MIELKYFEPKDFDLLIGWINAPDLLIQWAGTWLKFPLTKEQLEDYMIDANDIQHSVRLAYKIVANETGKTIGHISLDKIDREHKTARITKVLLGDNQMRGKGICPLIIKEILRIGFDELHLHRISLGVYSFNKSAYSCYEKSGFIKEGLLRDVVKVNGSYWSIIEMSILEEEWRSMIL